jgi:hypothetical protein
VERIDRSDILAPYILQHGCNIASLGRRHQEMNVIRHEHIRVHGAAATIRSFAEAFEIKTSIDIAEKTCSTIYPALDDVKRNPGKL